MFLLFLGVGILVLTDFLVKGFLVEIQTLKEKLEKYEAQCCSLTANINQLKLYQMKTEHQQSFMKTRTPYMVQEISNLKAG